MAARRRPAAIRRKSRQRRYQRRRVVALALLVLLAAGLYAGGKALAGWWLNRSPAGSETTLPFTWEYDLAETDLNGDGANERLAVSTAENGQRQLALVRAGRVVGSVISVADFPLAIADLERARGVLVWQGERPKRNGPTEQLVDGVTIRRATGGEPDWMAWRLDASKGLVPVDYYALIAPTKPPEPTVILVDRGLNVLWFYKAGGLVQTARVTTGLHRAGLAPNAANREETMLTPVGRFTIAVKEPGLPYGREKIPAGDSRNPLGTRWLGFRPVPADNGYRWGIHGTNDTSKLGQWLSDGSIGMANADIEALYERVQVGTPLVIIDSLQGL